MSKASSSYKLALFPVNVMYVIKRRSEEICGDLCKQRVTMHVHVHSGKTMTTDPKIQMVARGQDTCQPYTCTCRYYLF